jgi:hypothetical protein
MFTVDPTAPLHEGNVILATCDFGDWILPWTADGWIVNGYPGSPYTPQQWNAEMAMSPISFAWDDGTEVVDTQGPIQSACVGTGGGSLFLRTYGRRDPLGVSAP